MITKDLLMKRYGGGKLVITSDYQRYNLFLEQVLRQKEALDIISQPANS